ncbi:MAG: TetR/AcrR family transcriptional regulator [Acidimicrobiales bacterium]
MTAVNPVIDAADPLTADRIIDAALAILAAEGLDAVSMRRVATDLGVSPIPVYSRVGNKDALLDAMAARLGRGFDVPPTADEPWATYALRWCHQLRLRRRAFADNRLLMRGWRPVMVEATRPLVRTMREQGVETDAAIDAARMLVWTVLGHAAIELGHETTTSPTVDVDADRLFDDHVRYVITGLVDDLS